MTKRMISCFIVEECFPAAERVIRCAIKKDTVFDVRKLRKEISRLPSEYELRKIDSLIYDKCLNSQQRYLLICFVQKKLNFRRTWEILFGLQLVLMKRLREM